MASRDRGRRERQRSYSRSRSRSNDTCHPRDRQRRDVPPTHFERDHHHHHRTQRRRQWREHDYVADRHRHISDEIRRSPREGRSRRRTSQRTGDRYTSDELPKYTIHDLNTSDEPPVSSEFNSSSFRHRSKEFNSDISGYPRASQSQMNSHLSSKMEIREDNIHGHDRDESRATIKGDETSEKEGVNLERSGALMKDPSNQTKLLRRGVLLKYSEVAEGRRPHLRWRWHVFKEGEQIGLLQLWKQSWFLIGRDMRVTDVPMVHPSVSMQHGVLQYRRVAVEQQQNELDREPRFKVLPYLMDLDSTHGTFINGDRIEPRRFYQLLEKDVLEFGRSSRKYIVMIDRSGKGSTKDVLSEGNNRKQMKGDELNSTIHTSDDHKHSLMMKSENTVNSKEVVKKEDSSSSSSNNTKVTFKSDMESIIKSKDVSDTYSSVWSDDDSS